MHDRPDGNRGQLALLLGVQARLVEVVVAAAFIGIGINLLAMALSSALPVGAVIAIGGVLGGLGVLVVGAQLLRARASERTIRGVFLYDPENAEVLSLGRGYPFGSWFASYLSAACREVPTIKEAWGANREHRLSHLPDMHVARDLAEYVLLREFVVHLIDYFDETLVEYVRGSPSSTGSPEPIGGADLPGALRQNPFVSLFSAPPSSRPNFGSDQPVSKDAVMAYVVGGGAFERFDLVLPSGSRVMRPRQETIDIATPRFTLSMTTACVGTVASLPALFLSRYLRLTERASRVLAVDVVFSIRVRFRVRALLTTGGWADYRWLDSWVSTAQAKLSHTDYLSRIGWPQVETLLIAQAEDD